MNHPNIAPPGSPNVPAPNIPIITPVPRSHTGDDVRAQLAAADAAAGTGLNTSGIRPVDLNVLVRMDEVKTQTAGGVLLPEAHADLAAQRDIEVTFIEAGKSCFKEWEPDCRPTPGQRVIISRHAGMEVKGRTDGLVYRVLSDVDVRAVIEDQGEQA